MSRQDFQSKDLDLLESGLFADATITCGDRIWKVHKSIICRCDWFKKAFTGDFEEAQTNNVNISVEDFPQELVHCAISFIYSGVVNINLLDTNDSLVDAWVRVWVISDFLVLKELQKEAINGLEKYCDEKVKALFEMVCDNKHKITRPKFEGHKVLLPQLFRGVETAYSQYPHSVPCQQVLVDFFYAVRAIMFRRAEFIRVVSKAPLQFSQELFIATIKGRVSRWTPEKVTDFHYTSRTGNCTFCKDPSEKHRESWSVDPSLSGVASSDKALSISWRCTPCVEKHGFDCVAADEENH